MKSGMLSKALLVPAIAAGVVGFTLPPSMAMAQASQDAKTDVRSAAVNPDGGDTVGGVVVQSPPQRSKLGDIPPDKAAAFDQEAEKNEAWKRYRKSTPPLSAGTLGQANDYPGLQSLLPPPDEAAPQNPVPLR